MPNKQRLSEIQVSLSKLVEQSMNSETSRHSSHVIALAEYKKKSFVRRMARQCKRTPSSSLGARLD